ncbi:MAG: glycine--tRNA ligase subunit beta [Gammaproteobacteria bacterium]|nr:glycine--tRNA ligase subunit beta [Gammaproteobacteria bacterium]
MRTDSTGANTPGDHRDFLIELGTEELPPLALPELERALAEGIRDGLLKAGLPHGALESFATPRRLAVRVRDLAARQPDSELKRRGPPVSAAFDADGRPTRAALAFAESCGVPPESLGRVHEAKGEFLFFTGHRRGLDTVSLLPDIVRGAVEALPIPKRMRWGAGEAEFVRPVHWLVMLFGSDIVPARLLDTDAGRATRGHRFHGPPSLPLESPATYATALRERGHVLADFAERRERIREGVLAAARTHGGHAVVDEALLDEVTALVEWPVAVAGRFEERFLTLPREVLMATLQAHQRYFPVQDTSGALAPWFVTVSNIESRDPAQVRAGNERVVRPRLSDAAFFREQDRRAPLAARFAGLQAVTYQARLGSVGERVARIRTLASRIAVDIGGELALAERAAQLCKCDLLTAMVGEFPELQGVMGRYYALADGEPPEVAEAIREHYLPRGAGDALPETHTGLALALADKLDALAGIFVLGEKPSGTKDPFGLRRAAIGLLRILVEKRLALDLRALIEAAVAAQPLPAPAGVVQELYAYAMERLRAYDLERTDTGAITTEMFDAVLALAPRSPLDFEVRLRALGGFLAQPEALSLTAANKRTANILKKTTSPPGARVDLALLREPAERELHAAMGQVREPVARAIATADYAGALATLARLRPQVDAFFDAVMVMAEDAPLRANRLALLVELRELFGGIADLSRLPG